MQPAGIAHRASGNPQKGLQLAQAKCEAADTQQKCGPASHKHRAEHTPKLTKPGRPKALRDQRKWGWVRGKKGLLEGHAGNKTHWYCVPLRIRLQGKSCSCLSHPTPPSLLTQQVQDGAGRPVQASFAASCPGSWTGS